LRWTTIVCKDLPWLHVHITTSDVASLYMVPGAMTAIVPSPETQRRHPASGPPLSYLRYRTRWSGAMNRTHRAKVFIVLKEDDHQVVAQQHRYWSHSSDHIATEPSSAPPTTSLSPVRSF